MTAEFRFVHLREKQQQQQQNEVLPPYMRYIRGVYVAHMGYI